MKNIIQNVNGFTLIEAVISLGVLSIGILAMFSMQTLGIRGNASANRITTETILGADKIEQLIFGEYGSVSDNTTNPVSISSDGKYDILDDSSSDVKYQLTWTATNWTPTPLLTPLTPLHDMKTVTITATNIADGKAVVLKQIKADADKF